MPVTVAVTPNLARSNVVIVAGTDTSVGKTWAACALGQALRTAGRRVVAVKVVETGCGDAVGATEDGALLARATGQPAPLQALIRLREPLTPALAAEREGTSLEFDEILLRLEELASGADLLLVEGSGGLLAPLSWEWNLVDLAQALEARAVVVGSDRAGTVSHALLTLSALELGGIPVAAVILTPTGQPDGSTGSNAAANSRLSGQGNVVTVPTRAEPDGAAALLSELAFSLVQR
jgi:dethiobiotin synthetase